MRWIFKTHLLLTATLILGYVFASALVRWRDTWSGGLAALPAIREAPASAGVPASSAGRSGNGERVFVVATVPRDIVRADLPRPLESLILVCPHGEAAAQTARMLREYGYFQVEIMPGAAAAEAEPRRGASQFPDRLRTLPLAPGCVEWRPFAM
jgi:rhodanese-related sulfurtransferase